MTAIRDMNNHYPKIAEPTIHRYHKTIQSQTRRSEPLGQTGTEPGGGHDEERYAGPSKMGRGRGIPGARLRMSRIDWSG